MKFSYEELISGSEIFVPEIGHFRSPKLKELKPTEGIGSWNYNLFLSALSWSKEDVIKFLRVSTHQPLKALDKADKLNTFDIFCIREYERRLLQDAMSFFITEEILWNEKKRCFETYTKENGKYVGTINRNNYEEVKDMMLQMNYINVGKSANPAKHSSEKAKNLWEIAQQRLKEQSAKAGEKKETTLGNVISKICAAGIGYNLLNIYELTVFQLYDQFFQYGYLRVSDLNERAFTIHGGKNFKIEAWLKPITNF